MSKWDKHIGVGEPLIINEEEIVLKPLNVDDLPLFFKVMKCFSGASDKNAKPEDIFKNLDDAGLTAMKQIIERTLEKSYPDDWAKEEEKEKLKSFGLKYMQDLLNKIMEINMHSTTTQSKKDKMFKHLANVKPTPPK